MKKIVFAVSVIAASSAISISALAAPVSKASGMHYGPAKVARTQVQSKDAYSVTVTNCSYQMENVYAWFTDGSSKEMPIYPANNYPMNIISIDYPSDYPYVYIEVTALDGTVLFPQTAEYPGAYVNIGCDDATLKAGKYPVVTVTK